MPKCSLLNKILQLRVSTCILIILVVLTVCQFFLIPASYNYAHIPKDDIQNELYKEVNPLLVRKPTKPDCNYDHILSNTHSLHSWEISKTYETFSVKGLVNGSYVPEDCNPLFSVAILVTYRNRQKQLDVFLPYMHNFLRKQNIHYKIYLIEQQDEEPWNKGVLYNIGAQHAIADHFPCLILHDVDILPLDEGNLHVCTRQPRHLSASVDKFRFVLPYSWLVGGVLAIPTTQYTKINGFSTKFKFWGGEDDDFASRIFANNLDIVRFPRVISRYTMLPHLPAPRNAERYRLLQDNAQQRQRGTDGLSHTYYRTVTKTNNRLFTLIAVKL